MATHGRFRHGGFAGRVVMVGFGAIAHATLPLLQSQLGIAAARITVVSPPEPGVAAPPGIRWIERPLQPHDFEAVLAPLVAEGDLVLNLSVNVSSAAVMAFAQARGALYVDACTEPWPGRCDNPQVPTAGRTNYVLREEALALGRRERGKPTACITQGANPGLANFFVRRALLNMAADLRLAVPAPETGEDWARLAQALQVKVIHIAERDTQRGARRKRPGEFVNTWSVDAFIEEGLQPAELGWGSHERRLPPDGREHEGGGRAGIYLERPGFGTRVRTYTPVHGPCIGFLITHAESISIAEALTIRDEAGAVAYRPTVHYAYHPCEDAVLSIHELAGRGWQPQAERRILRDDIVDGMDELGVLLMGNPRGAYWFGSRLTTARARELAPGTSATTLQVAAGLLGAIVWALRHPAEGVVEADDMDLETVMSVAKPWLGELVGTWADWTPLKDRRVLFDEQVDASDPWQFANFRAG